MNRIEVNSKLKAVIDLGTNTCRLFIAEVENNKIKTSYLKEMEIVTLGEDVNKTKRLKESAIIRTIDCLKKYKTKCNELGIKNIIAKATSATRDSENRDEFIERVFKETGIKIECISGKEEGTYTFRGATIDIKDELVLLDIGGGSTEVIYGNSEEIKYLKSFDIGAVRIREKYFENDDFTSNYDEAKKWVLDEITELSFLREKEFTLVAVAGTATTQVSVKEKMVEYDSKIIHKYRLIKSDIESNIELYKKFDLEERKNIVGLHPKRADVIIGGTYILDIIMDFLGKDALIISENDILEGIMVEA